MKSASRPAGKRSLHGQDRPVERRHLSNQKPGRTTSGSGRGGAQRSKGAARGRIGWDAVSSIRPEDNPRSCPPANREHFLERLFGSTNRLTCRIPNPDILRASRVGAPGGAAERGRARLGAYIIICPENKSHAFFQRHRRNVALTSLQKHEHAKTYVNRRRNKISG